MAQVRELKDVPRKLTQAVEKVGDAYSAGKDRPLGGYLATMSVYSAVVGTLALTARLRDREIPADGLTPYQVVLAAAATHKISRLLTKDPVTSPLRTPFTKYEGTAGPAELSEEARGHGVRKSVGELVSCPFCASVWVATGLTAGLIFLPRTTKLVTGTFTAMAGADMLQFGHAWLEKAAS